MGSLVTAVAWSRSPEYTAAMADPLALVSLALAAAGGRLDGHDAGALVAAGHALLQRSAVLVRALSGRRSALFMPPGYAWLTALAASDGRGALILPPDPVPTPGWLAEQLTAERVGALFTLERYRTASEVTALPPSLPLVLLDDAPGRATVQVDGQARVIDLGSHFGLALAGDLEIDGLDEECLGLDGHWYSHRALLAAARRRGADEGQTPPRALQASAQWTAEAIEQQMAVLLQGGTLSFATSPRDA